MICRSFASFTARNKDVCRARIFMFALTVFFIAAGIFCQHADSEPDKSTAHYDAGLRFLNEGRYNDAITEFESSLQNDEGVLDTHLHLAHLYQFVRDDRSRAQYHYDAYMSLLRSLSGADRQVVASTISSQHEKAAGLFQDALAYLQSGDNGRARDLLLEAVELHPYDPMMQYNLGIASHRLGLYDDAVRYYTKAAGFFHESEGILFALGTAYQQNGDEHAAMETYRKVLAVNPRHVQALNNCAVLLERAGMYDAASAYYETIISVDPQYFRAYNNLAVLYALRNNTGRAEELLKNAVAVRPGYLDAHFNLGKLYENTQNMEAALEEYRFVCLYDSSYPDVIRRISDLEGKSSNSSISATEKEMVLLSGTKTHPALNHDGDGITADSSPEAQRLEKAVEEHPDDSGLYLSLAEYYCGQNRYDDALLVLDNAVRNLANSLDIRLARAGLLARQKLFYRAIMEYDAIIAEQPDCLQAHRQLSLLYVQDDNPLRDSRKAMMHYKRFQELGGSDDSDNITF